jgi:hypothetical protein
MRPPPSSHRVDDDGDEDDDDGRTVVRGAPRIVKRSSAKQLGPQAAPASISPAAVIKATLESARRRDQLVPGPPSELLEDSADFNHPAGSPRTPFIGLTSQPPSAMASMPTAPFEGPPSHRPPAGYMPPPSSRDAARSGRGELEGWNPSNANARAGFGPASAPVAYPGVQPSYVPNASASVPGVAMPPSMPAHFMTPQYSDPPGTAVTSGHKISGRPAMSWAAALLGCGLLVGVAAVAVMQGSDSAADTTASFVDPSRAAKAAQPAAAQPPAPVATVATPNAPVNPAVANAAAANPNPNAPPPGLIGASPVATVAEAPATPATAAAAAPAVTAPATPAAAAPHGVAFAPVAVPTSAPKPVAAPAPAPAPAPKPAVAWKPAPQSVATPTPKPVAKPAPVEEEPPKKATAKKGGGKGGGETDDETRKALEALQKAQLESASSFGDK